MNNQVTSYNFSLAFKPAMMYHFLTVAGFCPTCQLKVEQFIDKKVRHSNDIAGLAKTLDIILCPHCRVTLHCPDDINTNPIKVHK